MSIKMIDIESRVASCSASDSPRSITSPGGGKLVFFYHPEEDVVVMIEDHKCFDIYLDLAITYLSASDENREKFKKDIPADIRERLKEVLDGLDEIILIRRKRMEESKDEK